MAEARRFLGVGFWVVSSLVFVQAVHLQAVHAQVNNAKPADGSSKPATGAEHPSPTFGNRAPVNGQDFNQVEVLTDTMGVNFGPYVTEVVKKVKQNWYDVMPPSVYRPEKKQGKAAIEFFIQKNGEIKHMKLYTPPGDVALDRAAWAGITASNPFAPLPSEFTGQELGLRLYFYYNPEAIDVTPIMVQVAVGSTQQFSAWLRKNSRPASATWRVFGTACSKSPCGTVSDEGLYTAPAEIPNPPTVFIEATERTGVGYPSKAQITVVQSASSH